MTLQVVAVNPSVDKSKTVPVRIDLPQEITPELIVEQGELEVEFDEQRSVYYLYKPEVTLAPKQTRVFEVVVRDVWFVPEAGVSALQAHTNLVLKRLENTEYYESAKQLGDSILERLDAILQAQRDETMSRKQRIGAYRRNLLTIQEVKDDLARLEKFLSFAGGIPTPDMLDESPLKADAPSTTTTWLIIFLIIVFMGLLAGQFFFTWHRRTKASSDFTQDRQAAFPGSEPSQEIPSGGRRAV